MPRMCHIFTEIETVAPFKKKEFAAPIEISRKNDFNKGDGEYKSYILLDD